MMKRGVTSLMTMMAIRRFCLVIGGSIGQSEMAMRGSGRRMSSRTRAQGHVDRASADGWQPRRGLDGSGRAAQVWGCSVVKGLK